MGPTRVGFVGVNDRARRLLLPGLLASPRARLVAVCSRDAARARAAAESLGPGVRPFTRVEEMAGSGEVDAVFVNTPTPAHPPACLAAIAAGCAVICEKPLAGSTAEASALCAAAHAAGVRTAVNFTYRSVPGFRLTERILRRPGLGPPLHAEVAFLQGHTFLPGYPRHSALLESGVHLLDTLLALAAGAGMGRVTEVSATPLVGGPDSLPGPVDFGWAFLARSASGAVLVGHFSRAALGWRNGFRWGLYGERAALAVELDATRTEARLALRNETPEAGAGGAQPFAEWRPLPLPPDLAADDARFPQYHLDRLVGAIRGEEPPGGRVPNFGAALETHRLADALSASAAGGGWAPVATATPPPPPSSPSGPDGWP
jgi:predicted dehydrogenase